MKKNQDTEILIFAYNRPSHLKRLIISLEDYGINAATLFLDGPKNIKDKVCQDEIIFMLKTNKLIKFNIFRKKKNLGLAESLQKGIDKMSKKYKKLIILEDDCIPRKEFFLFMHKAFEVYKNKKNISAICGYQLPDLHQKKKIYIKSILLNHFIPWGWGVWSEKWIEYRKNKKKIFIKKILNRIKASNIIKLKKFLNLKRLWTPRYVIYNYIFNNSYIFPSKSLVKNIGFDGSGINSKFTNKFNTYYTPSKKILIKKNILIDKNEAKKQENTLSKMIKYYY